MQNFNDVLGRKSAMKFDNKQIITAKRAVI